MFCTTVPLCCIARLGTVFFLFRVITFTYTCCRCYMADEIIVLSSVRGNKWSASKRSSADLKSDHIWTGIVTRKRAKLDRMRMWKFQGGWMYLYECDTKANLAHYHLTCVSSTFQVRIGYRSENTEFLPASNTGQSQDIRQWLHSGLSSVHWPIIGVVTYCWSNLSDPLYYPSRVCA